jgi:hypothetical protein
MSGTSMLLLAFKRVVKGALRGFATIELPSGLRITDCPVLVSSGKAWATLPSKPVLGADGRQSVIDGKRQYVAILEWKSRDLSTRFSQAVVDLVQQQHPDALDEEADPPAAAPAPQPRRRATRRPQPSEAAPPDDRLNDSIPF